MRFVFDLDGTICETNGMDYEHAKPIWRAIEEVRRLHRAGNEVHIETARASTHRAMTRGQLRRWGLMPGDGYDRLSVGEKTPADVYIDDRARNAEDWLAGLA